MSYNQSVPSSSNPIDPIPNPYVYPALTLEEKVDCLAKQLSHLMEVFTYNKPTQTHHDTAEAEVDNFLSHHEEEGPKLLTMENAADLSL